MSAVIIIHSNAYTSR